jgi:hypothetical protein
MELHINVPDVPEPSEPIPDDDCYILLSEQTRMMQKMVGVMMDMQQQLAMKLDETNIQMATANGMLARIMKK